MIDRALARAQRACRTECCPNIQSFTPTPLPPNPSLLGRFWLLIGRPVIGIILARQAERSLNMYSVLPYFLAKMIADLPLTALFPTVSGAVMYKMTGLHPKRDR